MKDRYFRHLHRRRKYSRRTSWQDTRKTPTATASSVLVCIPLALLPVDTFLRHFLKAARKRARPARKGAKHLDRHYFLLNKKLVPAPFFAACRDPNERINLKRHIYSRPMPRFRAPTLLSAARRRLRGTQISPSCLLSAATSQNEGQYEDYYGSSQLL